MIYCTNKSSTTHTNTKGQLGFQKKKKNQKDLKAHLYIYQLIEPLFFEEDCICNQGKWCMGHSFECLQRGREGVEGSITNFEKIIQAFLDGENKKSL